jgi:hypothetical protein
MKIAETVDKAQVDADILEDQKLKLHSFRGIVLHHIFLVLMRSRN